MYFYIRNITNLKKGVNLPPMSKSTPENSYVHLCDDELRTTKKL